MNNTFGGSTRWFTLVDTVDTVVQANDDKINFGMKWFPSPTSCGNSCVVNAGFTVDPAPNNHTPIMTPLNALGAPAGSCQTPSSTAWTETEAAFNNQYPGEANAIMFVIDGAVNCSQSHATTVNAIE